MLDQDRIDYLVKDYRQGFPAFLGFEITTVDNGYFESRLAVRPEHLQQDGFVHAGVIATMADHTAGYAAYTTVADNLRILSIEFKINFFRPAVGTQLICRSRVINGGRTVIVGQSDVYAVSAGAEKQVSRATVTLMAVPAANLRG